METSAQSSAQSTQQFVDIESVKNGVIFLKGGGIRRVILVSGINFELKSDEEQNIIIGAYQSFLNSLDFSLQIMVHSRKLNIEKYITKLSDLKDGEPNDLLKEQVEEYVNFIKSFVEVNEIMHKNFFVIVPYNFISLEEGAGRVAGFFPFSKKKDKAAEELASKQSTEEKIQQLDQRVTHVVDGLSSIGLRAVPLNDEELVELFYNLYNPQISGTKEIKLSK